MRTPRLEPALPQLRGPGASLCAHGAGPPGNELRGRAPMQAPSPSMPQCSRLQERCWRHAGGSVAAMRATRTLTS